ncbi:MAG: S41 family peptidase, partial [Planctomycetota bacterium]
MEWFTGWVCSFRRSRRHLLRVALAAATLSMAPIGNAGLAYAAEHGHTDDVAVVAQSVATETQILSTGGELEDQKQWGEAVRHYEAAMRVHPTSRMIYQRLLISRLRYDVNRRYRDHSFLRSVRELNTTQALDLYSEVLANLQTHYVDSVDWARVILHGTAALEVALDESAFLDSVLAHADADDVERFRLNIHRELTDRSTQTRFDLRATVGFVAQRAHEDLGLAGTATALEFLAGAVSTLDPYTRLLSGSQLDEMFSNIEGNFVGLGIELKAGEGCLKILSVIPGGPAEEAGILAGEKIVRVSHANTRDSDPDYVADLLRGPKHSTVSIAVQGVDGQVRDLDVPRRRVDVPCVENVHMVDSINRVGYFRLTNFQKTTRHEVEQALFDLQNQGMRSLVMDLRGNPGGLLSAAVEVADRFLSDGPIVTTRGRNAKENFDYTAHRTNTWSYPMVVLIDGDSASA